jgi:hypothetical protein
VEQSVSNELVRSPAGLERGVELNDWIGPEKPLFKLSVYVLGNPLVTDDGEAARVVGVVVDETFAQIKDVDSCPLGRDGRARDKSRVLLSILLWNSHRLQPSNG